LIPGAVRRELQSPHAPAEIRKWITDTPNWLESRAVTTVSDDLLRLGAGEREATALAPQRLFLAMPGPCTFGREFAQRGRGRDRRAGRLA
jgi:hypothetical protein